MLQELCPEIPSSEPALQHGLANSTAVLRSATSLLEQFVQGADDDAVISTPKLERFGRRPEEQPNGDGMGESCSSPSPPPLPPRAPTYSSYKAQLLQPAGQEQGTDSFLRCSPQESSENSGESFCTISNLERLIRTHAIWFLPGIARAGAVHYLQGKEVGTFIVRQSSKPNTMALSVRLPQSKGPYIEHYLIETAGDGKLRLEGSDNLFVAMPILVAHYCQCCDELPVQLKLPTKLMQATTRQELSSLALLGQDFWVSSILQTSRSTGQPPPGGGGSKSPPLTDHNANLPHSTFKPLISGSPEKQSPQPASRPNMLPVSSPFASQKPVPLPRTIHPHPPPIPPPRTSVNKQQGNNSTDTTNCISTELANTEAEIHNGATNKNSSPVRSPTSPTIPKVEQNGRSSQKRMKKVTHYKRSNILESPVTYYSSSLADKISDYEDIWGTASGKESDKTEFTTFKPHVRKDSKQLNPALGTRLWNEISKEFVCQSTQTDTLGGSLPGLQTSPDKLHNLSHSMPGIEIKGQANGVEESSDKTNGRFSSPFYAEPVDSLAFLYPDNEPSKFPPARRLDKSFLVQRLINHRHSDPNIHSLIKASTKGAVDSMSILDENTCSSMDNLPSSTPVLNHRRHKSIEPTALWVQRLPDRPHQDGDTPRDAASPISQQDSDLSDRPISIKKSKLFSRDMAWSVDSSWDWIIPDSSDDDCDASGTSEEHALEPKFPVDKLEDSVQSDVTTVEDLIALKAPDLRVPDFQLLTENNVLRVSEYDNLEAERRVESQAGGSEGEPVDDTATEFSEPWDSLRWERLLRLVNPPENSTLARENEENNKNVCLERKEENKSKADDTPTVMSTGSTDGASVVSETPNSELGISEFPTMTVEPNRSKSFHERLKPLLAAHRVVSLRNKDSSVGENIRRYIFRLVEERNTTFAMAIENFIQCTKDSNETSPGIVMRNIRQFMSGMKNYLVKHGEGQFEQLVQEERSKLKSDEFLNIDAIIEGALHRLVIKPLKNYLYQLFVNDYTRNASLKLLSDNIKHARTKSPEEIGIRNDFRPPHGMSLEVVKYFLMKLQQSYSPLRKLENLLAAISTIYNSVQEDYKEQGKDFTSLGADDFLPIFIYVLVQCGMIAAEIEADYMWGLLHPSLLTGEGGYYLTTLSSAVHVLKNFQSSNTPAIEESQTKELPKETEDNESKKKSSQIRYPSVADLQGFMQIMIPDELSGSIISKTLPVRPNMTTKEVCKMIAHKFKITNPQDYGLFKLVKGEETQLGDNECPQTIKADLITNGIGCRFAYKRCDAKFIWPLMEPIQ